MNLRNHIIGSIVMAMIVFSIFVTMFGNYSERHFAQSLEAHARVIGEDLWARDRSGPVEYVKLAARLGKYRHLQVFEFEDDVFLELTGPELHDLDRFLFDIGLIVIETGETDINYNNEVIGRLVVELYCDNIYVQVYALALLIAFVFAYLFFIRTTQAKHELETRVTERTAELRKLQNYLSNIVNSMPSVLIGIDREGCVTQWNSEAQRVTGLSLDSVAGEDFETVFPHLSADSEQVRAAVNLQEVYSVHRRARIEDGETRFEDLAVFPLLAEGIEGAVIRLDDVTDRVRMEEMMIQSEKMLSVGGLAAGMAHEINNPLGGMMLTARALSDRIGMHKEIPANHVAAKEAGTSMDAIGEFMRARDIPQMLSSIIESGQRLAGIVSNMLAFSRKSDAGVEDCDLAELLDQTLELAATDFNPKKHYDFKAIEITRSYGEEMRPVPCEGSKIQQVMFNILINGAQAMRDCGVEQPRFNLVTGFEKERDTAFFVIEDNGPGMDQSVQKRIFEPFFTTKPVGEGTGLGLSICYFIITEQHKGEMKVESRLGGGTRFTVRLPYAEH